MNKPTSNASHSRQVIMYESLIVAYAMSRLDQRFLEERELSSWNAAFKAIGSKINTKPASLKNLRDEFDPVHNNTRRGWLNRPMRPNRQRVIAEFSELSDEGLMEIVGRILSRDPVVATDVVEPLATSRSRVENVAERLRTGRMAEEYFLRESQRICGIGAGDILFTDHEWEVARQDREEYWLIVVGCLSDQPRAKLHVDPFASLHVHSVIERCTRVSWRSRVRVA